MNEIMFEVRSTDESDVQATASEIGLEITPEGQTVGLDGATIATFAIAVVPSAIGLFEVLISRLLEKRRPVMIRTPNVTIRAESMDDLDRAIELYRSLASADGD